MKPLPLITRCLCAWLLFTSTPAAAQTSALQFAPGRVPVGRVLHYVKSELSGGHPAQISVYVAAADRIEALKWDHGGEWATLVTATMDWSKFSVRGFESWQLRRGAEPEHKASLAVEGDTLTVSLLREPVRIGHWPWHSYDFDFTSLNLTLPHLRDPEAPFRLWRTDFVYEDPPRVAELGEVHLEFQGIEMRAGKRARRYTIGGAGLGNHAGTWWADAGTGLLLEYEIPVGDEPGFANVRLKFERSESMSPQQWDEFKRRAVAAAD